MLVRFYHFIDTLKNSPARRNKLLLISQVLALVVNLILWGFLFWQMNRITAVTGSESNIPLHYNIYFGIDKYGPWYHSFILPLSGLIIWLMNVLIAFLIYSKKSLIAYFFTAASLLAQLILFIAAILIVLINI
jgi:hypothetical protein